MTIERPQPITHQVNQIIRERIRNGEYLPGSRMPSEGDLAAEMGISRTTLRMAMTSLVNEGIVIRKQGDGTYVNKRALEISTHYQNFWSFSKLIEDGGHHSEVKKLASYQRTVSAEETLVLEIEPDSNVYVLERLFFADNKPVIYSINSLPVTLIMRDTSHYDPIKSIYEFLREFADQEISYSTSDINAVLPPETVVKAMGWKGNRPLLKFFDLFYNKNNRPVVLGVNYFDDQFLGMRLVRTRG